MPYRKRDLQPHDPYYAQWQQYAHISKRAWVLFLLFWPVGPLVTSVLVETLWPSPPTWIVAVGIAPWVIAALVVSQAPIRWRCPRCGKPFHSTIWAYNGFARRCLHCKLHKWAPGA